MTIKRPTHHHLAAIATSLGMTVDDADIAEFAEMAAGASDILAPLDRIPDELPVVRYPRTPGYRPDEHENPYNAWYYRTEVRGADTGALTGRTIALKDNVCLAGVPMMNGASTLEGYVPDVDATIVTRILDAGGTITGKAHCEYYCYSGGSNTNATGPTLNPHNVGHTTGGSSSGSAALVAAGAVDMAVGSDQGGSIREPSAFCGIYGMKPTHGLVPYTGIFPMDPTIDHAGPMTASVRDNALLLQVLAGSDGLDPRQRTVEVDDYMAALDAGSNLNGMSIGVVLESLAMPGPVGVPRTDEAVRSAATRLEQLGASVREVSVPMHAVGLSVWSGVAMQGTYEVAMRMNGLGFGWEGLYVTSMGDAQASWRSKADQLSDNMKLAVMMGEYMSRFYGTHYYAKAQNVRRRLRAAYSRALDEYDLLLMPTTPTVAPPIPDEHAPRAQRFVPGFETIANTAPFDVTGHPAMSVPCGLVDGLPVGMMLVGRHFGETTIYRVASAYEREFDWRAS